jgi:drug/metabolite transporter (DMT)-like permease
MRLPAAEPAAGRAALDADLRGIGFLLITVTLFSFLDVCAKYLAISGRYDIIQLVWLRYAVHLALAFVFLWPWPLWRPLMSPRVGLQIVRALALVGATGLTFLALRVIQLAEAVSIMFSSPLMTAVLAVPFLGEAIGVRRIVACCVGLIGVLVVMRPGFGGLSLEMLLCLGGAVCYTIYSLMTRVVAQDVSSEAAIFYPALVGTLVLVPAVPAVWVTPFDLLDGALMAAIGLLGGVGHYVLIFAYRHTAAGVLQPFIYLQLVWTVVLGYVVFDEIPGPATALGASLVVASGIYVFYREQVAGRRATPA